MAAALAALAPFHPAAAERARAALGRLLAGIVESAWPEVAWSFSHLTGDGFPQLFTFCCRPGGAQTSGSRPGEIRYTCEIAGPEVPVGERLPRARALVAELGGGEPPAEVGGFLERVQRQDGLRFGAWVGGRHGPADDRYKLYAEVPPQGAREVSQRAVELAGGALRPGRPLSPRMIGYDPAAGRLELYYRAPGLEPDELPRLLGLLGLEVRLPLLLELAAAAWGRPLAEGFPGETHGFSLVFGPAGEPQAFSLFHFARAVFRGGDGAIRRRLLALGQEAGWNLGDYAAVSAPLAGGDGWRTHHDLVSLVLPVRGPAELQIGVRPVAGAG